MKTVIFDFGNVIIRWDPLRALNQIFASRAEMDETLAQIGFFAWNAEQDRGRSWAEGVSVAGRETPEHAHIFRAYADGLEAAHNQLVSGTSELIQRLHNDGVRLIGLTNASMETVVVVRRIAPVLDLMQDIVISAEVNVIKPDPAIYKICLARSDLEANDCLFVDDVQENCDAAQSVGIAGHHFTDAAGLEARLTKLGLL